MRYFLLSIFFLLLFGHQAFAQAYHPDFDCRRMDRNVPGQVLVCTDSDSARSSLILDQAYYALRHQNPAYLLPQLKAELLTDLKPLYLCFPPIAPVEGGDSAHCYRQKVEQIAAGFRSRLIPRAYQEASRPIDDHIALQHRLATLGYLRQNHLEGVYGDTTRRAILRWQEQTGRPNQDGFLGDDDAHILIPSLASSQAPAPQESTTEATASSPEQATPETQTTSPAVSRFDAIAFLTAPEPIQVETAAAVPQRPYADPLDLTRSPGEFLMDTALAVPAALSRIGDDILSALSGKNNINALEDFVGRFQSDKLKAQLVEEARAAAQEDAQDKANHASTATRVGHKIKQFGQAPLQNLGAIWLFLLLGLLIWRFHIIKEMIGDIFNRGHDDHPSDKNFTSKDGKEAYRYAKILERFTKQKRSGNSFKPKTNTSSSSARASSKKRTNEELTPAEMEAYNHVGKLWAGWISEFQLTDGSVLLDYLVAQRLRDAFSFLETLARSIEHEQALSILNNLARGRTWQDLQRCSYQLCDLLRIVMREKNDEIRRRQERKHAEDAERRSQQQKRQRARSSAAQGRPWHVVLEVSETATKEEIHASYKRLIKRYHPDRFAQKDEATKQEAAQRATELNQAYEYIKRHKTL